jgi:hypothetical protein
MAHWQAATPTDIQHDDNVSYYGGWTISGLAVVATVAVIWVLGM